MVGGVGSSHDIDDHHVTGCMHTHTHYHKESKAGSGGNVSSQMAQMQMQNRQQDAQFTLTDWIQRVINRGRGIFRGIWGTNETNTAGPSGDKTGGAQTMAQVGDTRAAADGAAGHSMTAHSTAAHSAETVGNPYFREISEKNAAAHMTPFQKIRSKVVAGAEKLAGRLPGKAFQFQTKNSFHAKSRQHSKENLRKRSRYKKDELEIDCVLTDESYLMDSYDRKGEYTQLTTKK